MVEPRSKLSLNRQFALLCVPKSTYYRKRQKRPDRDAFLKRLIQKVYRQHPHYGYRRVAVELGVKYEMTVGFGKIRSLMRQLGLKAIIRRRRITTTVADPDHRRYPNLLRGLRVEHSNQIWASDITYTSVNGQRAYVVSVKDLYSRKVLAWRVSNTMDASFCIEALETALARHGPPEIFHTDQGSQFTFCMNDAAPTENEIRISHTGKGRASDNAQAENLWYSLKYECLHHCELKTLAELRKEVNRYFIHYNGDRPHSAIGYRYPNAVYRKGLPNVA